MPFDTPCGPRKGIKSRPPRAPIRESRDGLCSTPGLARFSTLDEKIAARWTASACFSSAVLAGAGVICDESAVFDLNMRALIFAAAILASGGAIAFWLPEFGDSRSGDGHPGILPAERMAVVAQQRAHSIAEPSGAPDAPPANESGRRKADPQMDALHDLMARDPDAALAEARQRYDGETLSRVLAGLAGRLLAKDFSKAPTILSKLQDSLTEQSALFAAIPISFRRDPAGTMRIVREQLSGELQGHAFRVLVLTQKKAGDLPGAIETQRTMPASRSRRDAIVSIASEVARNDPDLAFRWLGQLSDGDEQKSLHGWMTDAFGEAKDDGNLARLLELTPADEPFKPGDSQGRRMWNRDHLVRRIAWLRQKRGDLASLRTLQETLPGDESALVDAVIIYADESLAPFDRIGRLGTLDDARAKNLGISSVIGMEVKRDAAAAATLVWSLPDPAFSPALGGLLNSWGREDRASLNAWVRALPAGPRRERTISSYAAMLRYQNKAMAREVVTWLTDLEIRDRLERELNR